MLELWLLEKKKIIGVNFKKTIRKETERYINKARFVFPHIENYFYLFIFWACICNFVLVRTDLSLKYVKKSFYCVYKMIKDHVCNYVKGFVFRFFVVVFITKRSFFFKLKRSIPICTSINFTKMFLKVSIKDKQRRQLTL